MEVVYERNHKDQTKEPGVGPSGPSIEVVYADGTTGIVTLAEAKALREDGKLLPADETDTRALSKLDVYGTTDV